MNLYRKCLGATVLMGAIVAVTARADIPCLWTSVPKKILCSKDKVGNCKDIEPYVFNGKYYCAPSSVIVTPPATNYFDCSDPIPVTMGSPPPTICSYEAIEWLWPLQFYVQDACYDKTYCMAHLADNGSTVCESTEVIDTVFMNRTIALICIISEEPPE